MSNITVQRIFEQAGYKCSSYSGRSMYGDECLAVSVGRNISIGQFFSNVLYTVDAIGEDDTLITIADMIHDMKTDNMGLGTVFYFPGVPFECEEDPMMEELIADAEYGDDE